MKHVILAAAALLATIASGSATEIPATPAGTLKVRTTAYTATEWNGGGYRSAAGNRLQYGGATYSAAADWSWLPLGTVFKMRETGRTYRIDDYGSALVGRKTVDLYMPDNGKMRRWGARHVTIEIISLGSYSASLAMLKGRQKSGHVRRMATSLRTRLTAGPLLAGGPELAQAE